MVNRAANTADADARRTPHRRPPLPNPEPQDHGRCTFLVPNPPVTRDPPRVWDDVSSPPRGGTPTKPPPPGLTVEGGDDGTGSGVLLTD